MLPPLNSNNEVGITLIRRRRHALECDPDDLLPISNEVEQAAFNPAHFVPGMGPSPDKMLQGRLFSYGDTHRYRLGTNHMTVAGESATRN